MSAPAGPAQQRRTILRGAAAALREHGTSAGMADIARAAGVGRATLYRHFATREALLTDLARFAADESARAVRDAVREADGPREAVLLATRALLAVGGELWTPPGPGADGRPGELALTAPLVELASHGQRDGVLRTDLPAAHLGALHGVLIQGTLRHPALSAVSLDEAARTVTRLYLDGATAPHPSRS